MPFFPIVGGSSPRMRGALGDGVWDAISSRIIPADAGSTALEYSKESCRRDHPRGCGEHSGSSGPCGYLEGSSPRMRGALSTCICDGRPRGDHPRGCGEHCDKCNTPFVELGSSPRMRGAHSAGGAVPPVFGIIPADAGSTRERAARPSAVGDHPRGCGEHGLAGATIFASAGSSPRMRGALSLTIAWAQRLRIIPADAGSTLLTGFIVVNMGDHPRGCGEHGLINGRIMSQQGSSPRMRGAQIPPVGLAVAQGIIPADAGSTLLVSPMISLSRDHPRGCGEHVPAVPELGPGWGSSPRMRGARRLPCHRHTDPGIIPADAGSTGWSARHAGR